MPADTPLFFGVIPGGVDIRGAGDGPAEIAFPLANLADPNGGIYTIQTGGQVQTLALARTNRTGWALQNFDADEIWWRYDISPVQYQSWKIDPYAFWICPPSLLTGGIIKILGARTGARFMFQEAF